MTLLCSLWLVNYQVKTCPKFNSGKDLKVVWLSLVYNWLGCVLQSPFLFALNSIFSTFNKYFLNANVSIFTKWVLVCYQYFSICHPFILGLFWGTIVLKEGRLTWLEEKLSKFKIYHSNKLLDCYCSVDFFPSFFKLSWRTCYPQNMQIYKDMFILLSLDINFLL